MTQVDLNKIAYSSFFPGLGIYKETILSTPVPAQTLDGTGIGVGFYSTRGAATIDNAYAISQVKITLPGLDTNHYFIRGFIELNYSGTTRVISAVSSKYSLDIYTSFADGQFKLELQIFTNDFTDPAISIPAFSIDASLKLFLPPFEIFSIS